MYRLLGRLTASYLCKHTSSSLELLIKLFSLKKSNTDISVKYQYPILKISVCSFKNCITFQ